MLDLINQRPCNHHVCVQFSYSDDSCTMKGVQKTERAIESLWKPQSSTCMGEQLNRFKLFQKTFKVLKDFKVLQIPVVCVAQVYPLIFG